MILKASIIIPTYHRKDSLLRLLNSISSQHERDIEVIVVEQGDRNEIEFRKFAYSKGLSLKYLFSKTLNTARAKNKGAINARGKYLIYFDDDVILHENVIGNLLADFKDPKIGCVAGRAITRSQPTDAGNKNVGRISPWSTFSDGFSSDIRQYVDTPVGCNMAFPKKLFFVAKGFDERFTGAIREESDLALRIKQLGYRVVFEPKATVTHLQEPTGGGRKTEGRLNWYYHFLSNETYFFLKHCEKVYFLFFIMTRMHWIFRCMFGFGREVSFRSIVTPFLGIKDGFHKYKELINENRG